MESKRMGKMHDLISDPVRYARFQQAMKYEPSCFALNALVERLIHGEAPLPQEIEDGKSALAKAGFRSNWEDRDFKPGVYGYADEDDT
jgi:hypothetical protein